MKRIAFLPLALLLSAGFLSTTAYPDTTPPNKEIRNMNELIKTDIKVGTGAEAKAGYQVSVHYTGWLYDENAPGHKGSKFDSSRDRGDPV